MLNVINGFYHPQEGHVIYKGEVRKPLKPYEIAHQGIARTFQNIALFKGMSTLDNIMTGRLTHMKTGMLAQALWWGKAQKEEVENRALLNGLLISLRYKAFEKYLSAVCLMGCKNVLNWAVPCRTAVIAVVG